MKENEELQAKLKAMEAEQHDSEEADKAIMELKLNIINCDSEIIKLRGNKLIDTKQK